MIEYIQEIFAKPELQRSFADNFWLSIIVIALVFAGLCLLVFTWWLFFELPDDIREWRKKKNAKDNTRI